MDKGTVTIVGAGCSKELITVSGLEKLRNADVVVYDDLIDDDLLLEVKSTAEKIYVGKRYKNHSKNQQEINRILIKKAKENKNVVRLKGGDSFVFGRGSEEIIALEKENIPYQTVGGVTSAVAVPEHFGIPVTYRSVAKSFTVVTGSSADESTENYAALAKLDGTLVFLMALHNIDEICAALIRNGKDKNTPCSLLSRGYCPDEKRIDGFLSNISDKVKGAKTPAIFVVGTVSSMHLCRNDFLPLSGASVTVTGSKNFSSKLCKELNSLGAYTQNKANLKIVPLTKNIPTDFSKYTCAAFTSANGVKLFFSFLKEKKIDLRNLFNLKFACIGVQCAKELSKNGFYADLIPEKFTVKAMGNQLAAELSHDDRVLILRSAKGSDDLLVYLKNANIMFDDVHIYTTEPMSEKTNVNTDYITFSSADGIRAFFENGSRINNAQPVCIGEITAKQLRKYTDIIPIVAKEQTANGIVTAIKEDRLNEKIQKIETE
ncbi:MAG: uroporphyrinogen-III C-methyltransferase [Clostridiales bacterium]|nr:uroporphyrinogen-III C-methyltransferase [Clostridiales bacterium]